MHGGAHAALSAVAVNALLYGNKCREEYLRVSLLSELVGILRSLQPATCCIVERLCGDEVVHVEVAVVSVLRYLFAVNGIAVLRVYLLGSNFLKTVEVTFSAIAIATFILKLVAHLGGSVLGIAARGLHGCHHPAATRSVVARFGLSVFYGNVTSERKGDTLEQVGTSR